MGVNARIPQQRLTREPRRQDAYRTKDKSRSGSQCIQCGAVTIRGRWYPAKEALAHSTAGRKRKVSGHRNRHAQKRAEDLCPACRQLKEHHASGVVEIQGERWKEFGDQIEETIFNTEEIARVRNDQHRILWTRTTRNTAKYYVTLPELARQIGRVLNRAFKGKVEYRRSTEEPFLRVVWDSDHSVSDPHPSREERRLGKSRGFRARAEKRKSRY